MRAIRDLSPGARRWGIRLAHANALFWAVGNGLVSTSLVAYLAIALGANGLAVGCVLAAPHLAGLLRLGTPLLFRSPEGRKRLCLVCFFSSSLLLAFLPFVAAPGFLPNRTASLTALVALWCVYHLLEYVGVIGLWSWLGDLIPARLRGRVLGRRERHLTMGRIFGMVVATYLVAVYQEHSPHHPTFIAYIFPALGGAGLMAFSAWAVVFMPVSPRWQMPAAPRLNQLQVPLANRRFHPLLAYGMGMALVNGLGDAARRIFLPQVLGVPLHWQLGCEAFMRSGQFSLAPEVGRTIDRRGTRGTMLVSQALLVLAVPFFLVATPDRPWLVSGYWVLSIAYVGLNIGLPTLTLRISPPGGAAAHFATYQAFTGLVAGLTMIGGGALLDALRQPSWNPFWQMLHCGPFTLLFLVTLLGRIAVLPLLGQIDDSSTSRERRTS